MSVYTVKFSGGRRPDYWVVTTGPDGQKIPGFHDHQEQRASRAMAHRT